MRNWLLALAGALWLHADPAAAARLTAVRIGTHPGYARVVLETDAPAAYQVLDASTATPGDVTIRIAAESRARDVAAAAPGSPAVTLTPQDDGSTLAHIRAAGPVRVETQVLAGPPRLVVDLRRAAAAAHASPPAEPKVAEVAKPEPAAPAEPTPQAVEQSEPPQAAEQAAAEPPAPAPEPEPVEAPPAVAAPPPAPPPPTLPSVGAPPPTLPSVSAPSPPTMRFDARSLGLGFAAGIGLALLAFAARRDRKPLAAPAPISEIAVEEPPARRAPVAAPSPAAAPPAEPEDLALDVLRMLRGHDARLAEIESRLRDLAASQARLEARDGRQVEEIASQRTALARLQRSLRQVS